MQYKRNEHPQQQTDHDCAPNHSVSQPDERVQKAEQAPLKMLRREEKTLRGKCEGLKASVKR